MEVPTAAEKTKPLPVVETPQKSMCVEFVQFCKEQHLEARAATTFLHVLHKKSWENECQQIREAMRPEVEALFAPIEKALAEGKGCESLLKGLIQTIRNAR